MTGGGGHSQPQEVQAAPAPMAPQPVPAQYAQQVHFQ